jgi:hypothetical protein
MSDRKIRQADGLLMNIPDSSKPVLPVKGQRNVLITSALPCQLSHSLAIHKLTFQTSITFLTLETLLDPPSLPMFSLVTTGA